jgi:hypothetical protein
VFVSARIKQSPIFSYLSQTAIFVTLFISTPAKLLIGNFWSTIFHNRTNKTIYLYVDQNNIDLHLLNLNNHSNTSEQTDHLPGYSPIHIKSDNRLFNSLQLANYPTKTNALDSTQHPIFENHHDDKESAAQAMAAEGVEKWKNAPSRVSWQQTLGLENSEPADPTHC